MGGTRRPAWYAPQRRQREPWTGASGPPSSAATSCTHYARAALQRRRGLHHRDAVATGRGSRHWHRLGALRVHRRPRAVRQLGLVRRTAHPPQAIPRQKDATAPALPRMPGPRLRSLLLQVRRLQLSRRLAGSRRARSGAARGGAPCQTRLRSLDEVARCRTSAAEEVNMNSAAATAALGQ